MIVRIGGQELRPFGLSNRPSYINALLISSRGVWQPDACTACRAKIEADPNGYASPFAFCGQHSYSVDMQPVSQWATLVYL
jgi:hypothetical protein